MSDPLNPPAIVQPALFADRLTALMAEAQTFGRKTVEAKIATGRKLLEAMAEWEGRDGQKPTWKATIARYGFADRTARRLMAAARSADHAANLAARLLKSQPFNADDIYDDGIDPDCLEGKKPCRECRMRGKEEFSPKCAACRALNRPTPKPKEDAGPVLDCDGHPVPEHLIPVWNDAETIRSFNTNILNAAKGIKGITERPCGRGVPAEHFLGKIKALLISNYAFRPGFVCQDCQGQGCVKCDDSGWFPEAVVRGQRAAAKKEERRKQWQQHNQPIPE